MSPPRHCCRQAKPAPPPLLSPPFHRHPSTLIASPTLPPKQPHTNNVAFAAALPATVISLSPFQPCCHNYNDRVAVSAKQSPHHRRCYLRRLANCRSCTVSVTASYFRRRCQLKPVLPPSLSLPPFPLPPFHCHRSSLGTAIVTNALPSLLSKSRAAAVSISIAAALPIAAGLPSQFHPHCVAADAAKRSPHRRHLFCYCLTRRSRFAISKTALLTPLLPLHRCRRKTNPALPPLLSLPFHPHCFTYIALSPPPNKSPTAAAAVAAALSVSAVSTSLFHTCCRHCCHRIAVATKQSPVR